MEELSLIAGIKERKFLITSLIHWSRKDLGRVIAESMVGLLMALDIPNLKSNCSTQWESSQVRYSSVNKMKMSQSDVLVTEELTQLLVLNTILKLIHQVMNQHQTGWLNLFKTGKQLCARNMMHGDLRNQTLKKLIELLSRSFKPIEQSKSSLIPLLKKYNLEIEK